MVDTAYYDDAMNNKYNLKLAAKTLAKQKDNYPGADLDTILPNKKPVAYATFQDQSLFKVIYEPTYDRVMLQAKQVTFIAKDSLAKNKLGLFKNKLPTVLNMTDLLLLPS